MTKKEVQKILGLQPHIDLLLTHIEKLQDEAFDRGETYGYTKGYAAGHDDGHAAGMDFV